MRPLAQAAAVITSKVGRICITPGGVPHIKVVQNGHVIDKLLIDIKDPENTCKAVIAIWTRSTEGCGSR